MRYSQLLCVAALLVVLVIGCRTRQRDIEVDDVLGTSDQERSQLDQVLDMLSRIEQFERGPALETVNKQLSNYLAGRQADKQWKPDTLVSRLPQSLRRALPPYDKQLEALPRDAIAAEVEKKLASLEVQPGDSLYLEESLLFDAISKWVVDAPTKLDLEDWLVEQEKTLGHEATDDLRAATRLFDWTARNIRLDPLLPSSPDAAGADTGGIPLPAALRGVPGPGYMSSPWHAAMTGHGDAWQRARVMILLARQRGIDVVMLALPASKDDSSKLTPWACGVLIGKDLYLFDPALGLPIPGPNQTGIATLAQVIDSGELLTALDVDAEHPYPIKGDQVRQVGALIDGSLEALSQRMAILERNLVGKHALKLTARPSDLSAKLLKSPGVASTSLWNVPIEATLFQIAITFPHVDPQLRMQVFEERILLEQRMAVVPLAQARYFHLRGQLASTVDRRGAKELYVDSRLPDTAIDSLVTNVELQERLGMSAQLKEIEDPQKLALYIETIQRRLRRCKHDADYWLALAHYESGDYADSANWLLNHTLKTDKGKFWENAAHYNLGRAYEKLDEKKLAQEQYLSVEGPQQLGSLVRAKRLAK